MLFFQRLCIFTALIVIRGSRLIDRDVKSFQYLDVCVSMITDWVRLKLRDSQ